MTLRVRPSALLGSLLLWLLLTGLGRWLGLTPIAALLGGFLATLLHWLGELVHQLGHAWAARRTGYPMQGVEFWGVLATSRYPTEEGALPASVHIQRALGGPLLSALLTLLTLAAVLILRDDGGLPWYLALFAFFNNLLVYTLGALLPLGFTDGSTILYWWGRR